MALRDKYKTSAKLETNGIWYEADNTRVLLARAGGSNAAYLAAVSKLAKENQRLQGVGALPEAKAKKQTFETFAETVVLDWETRADPESEWRKGIESPDGGDLLPVTFENIVATFYDVPDFFFELKTVSEDLTYYREALIKDIAGN